ncbi:hypothetical protein PspLS_01643 [Pyricularia sp. CBS 133598]|nr:hypothetical protein PspLS_01643 [Pyricularia sp. CBS 133598]
MFKNPVIATGFPICCRTTNITKDYGLKMLLGFVTLLTNYRQMVPFTGAIYFLKVREDGAMACCISNSSVPMGGNFLTAYRNNLNRILKNGGSISRNPWRITKNFYWYGPDACNPAEKVQIVLSSEFKFLFQFGFKSRAHIVSTGAIIFGHSWKFPLRWKRKGDDPLKQREPNFADKDVAMGIITQLGNSGIRMSTDSSSGVDSVSKDGSSSGGNASSSLLSTPTSLNSLGHNPTVPVDKSFHLPSAPSSAGGGDELTHRRKSGRSVHLRQETKMATLATFGNSDGWAADSDKSIQMRRSAYERNLFYCPVIFRGGGFLTIVAMWKHDRRQRLLERSGSY